MRSNSWTAPWNMAWCAQYLRPGADEDVRDKIGKAAADVSTLFAWIGKYMETMGKRPGHLIKDIVDGDRREEWTAEAHCNLYGGARACTDS